jgi:uncharacterized protein with HEPN domain
MKDDAFYLHYILDCIKKVEEDTSCGYEIFMRSHLHQDAVLRNLHTITESTQRVSNNIKEKYTNIDWRSISAFRNVLVHDYLGIDIERIWQTVSTDIPDLKRSIEEILIQVSKS